MATHAAHSQKHNDRIVLFIISLLLFILSSPNGNTNQDMSPHAGANAEDHGKRYRLLARSTLGVNAEGDKAVVNVIGQRVGNHGYNHNDVLTGLLHREEWDNVVGKILPAQALEQYPADAQLQCQTNEESTNKQQQLTLEVVLGLEYPIAVPQETVDNTQHIARNVRDTVRKTHLGVEQIECHQGDERVQHAYHAVLEQLDSRLAGFGFIYLHDNSSLEWQN